MSNFVHEVGEDENFRSTIIRNVENGDPDAKVAALSSRTLMATNRYICEVCHKGFQRDQNLQVHRKGHNLPWKLMQRPTTQVKKGVYVCPKPNCVHHHPSRALGDLTGVKKHFCRKHGEKKWKCDKCSKCYAVQSDWKAHTKICGTREHRCDCGIIFSSQNLAASGGMAQSQAQELFSSSMPSTDSDSNTNIRMNPSISRDDIENSLRPISMSSVGVMVSSNLDPILTSRVSKPYLSSVCGSNACAMAIGSSFTSSTALLQKAAEMGTMMTSALVQVHMGGSEKMTADFLWAEVEQPVGSGHSNYGKKRSLGGTVVDLGYSNE
ncbi:hypothetical protein CUMW_053170 [Citrus unshiu]|nr:hypothetical protein CUMW_053170 [Citrus unshiu]